MTPDKRNQLGSKIRALRKSQGLTLRDLGAGAGVHIGYLSELERGEKKNPSARLLRRIAGTLSVPPSYFLEENGDSEVVGQAGASNASMPAGTPLVGEPTGDSGASGPVESNPADGALAEDEYAGLREFLEQEAAAGRPVPSKDVMDLQRVQFRGKKPGNAEDWRLFYQFVKRFFT